MPQHDYDIANQAFPATRADINNAIQAANTNNSGNTAPTTTYPNMFWCDTAANLIKQRNTANTAWITIGTLNTTNWGITGGGSSTPDATSSVKGKLALTNDLGGNADAPTVPGLATKANTASPTFTGTPSAPTASPGTNTTQLATTAFVEAASVGGTTPDATSSIKGKLQLAGDLGGTSASPTVPGLATKANSASPAFTGTPTAPNPGATTNTTQIATTSFTQVIKNLAISYASNNTTLKNLPVATDKIAYRAGFNTPGDFGHGYYRWVAGDTTTSNDGSSIVSNLASGRWLHIYEGYCYGELFGALGNGANNDSPAMNAAVEYIHLNGGGTLLGAPSHIYRFNSVSAFNSNRLLSLLKGVSIDGQGCVFLNNSMPNRFIVAGGLVNPPAAVTTKYITADFAHGDTTLTLDNVTGLAVGNIVWVRCGEDAGDTVESSYYFFTTITAIAGNVITIDKPVNQTGDVSAFVNAENKSVRVYVDSAENYTIKNITIRVSPGGFTGGGGGSHSSPAVYQYRGRNVVWENVTCENIQACYYQYMENVTMNNVRVFDSPFNSSSTGRAWNFAECRGVHVNNWYVEGITASVAYVEFYSSAIRFTNGIINNNVATWPLGGFRYLFGAVYETQITVDTLTIHGYGGWNMVENGSGADYSTFRDIEMKTTARARNLGLDNYEGDWIFNTPTYVTNDAITIFMSHRNWFWQRIPLAANMNGTYFYMPPGFITCNGMVYTSNGVTLGNITAIRVSRDGEAVNTGVNFKTPMQVGKIARFGLRWGTDDGGAGLATTPILSRVRIQVNTGGVSPGGFLVVGLQLAFHGNNGTYFNGISLTDAEANQMFA